MATAGDWISAAYNRSSKNAPGKLALDPELLDHLNRMYQRLFALFARARPDEGGSRTTLLLAAAPPQVALPVGTIDLVLIQNALGAKVHLIPSHELLRLWHVAPAVYRFGMTLYSRNAAGDPIAGDTLTVQILDAPAPLVTTAAVIDARFPVRHHQVGIDALGVYLSAKDAGREEGDRAAMLGELKTSLAAFAAEYALPPGAVEWIHASAERQGGATG